VHAPNERWLRWIAGFKLVKATLLLLAAVAAVGLLDPVRAEHLSHWAMVLSADRHYRALDLLLQPLASIDPHTIRVLGLGASLYAVVFYTEGAGLFLRRRWAEFMTIVTTGGLIPFELYEMHGHPGPAKVGVLAANVAILGYLVLRVTADE
jgi:uncharacterized membrane protein (DUF2068 family)